ncbi:Saccharopine dehydrogenase-domain-containing protein [Penicillium cinerascens]|uniref:Saccharopine dehydrogenase-domain-containing protein n=1 Tax=Penicillium cinerascens TaxID=70096 RepID=A0A9W9MPH1_9EURO|nr:Saccharopine dehydrogenase-domain-containing protein [Penicillium cinerascens]KAJ5205109.1 Saccharopine dehydrogenase-domain-containing protein [Penicillium cinerascens]
MSKPIIFIGASGAMCQLVIQRFIKANDTPFILADINVDAAEAVRASLPSGRATTLKLDLFDHGALVRAITGTAIVVLGAGPYTRTAHPVMEACLEVKVLYLDFDDDVESTQAALNLNERAKKEGVAFFIGCGASPGMSNVIAIDAAKELDSVSAIDLFWLVGNEKGGAGKAVMEHLMHIASGPCLTWISGKPTIIESYEETRYAPMVGKSTEMILHETAHPEPVTLPRLFPKADSIRCFGALYPPGKFGCARGLGNAVRRGILSLDEACDFQVKARHGELEQEIGGELLKDLLSQFPKLEIKGGEASQLLKQAKRSSKAAVYAFEGLLDQIHRGESTAEEVRDFIVEAAGYYEKVETAGALLVRVVGSRNGHPAVVAKRTPTVGVDSYLHRSMATMTGTSCAAFMVLALQAGKTLSGVFCPEDWAEPASFYGALETVGVPKHELPETYRY